jgi:4-hydroxy 2-oxovalerate aldolase
MTNNNKILLLDATLRDGGQGLEDGFSNKFYSAKFENGFIGQVIPNLVSSNIDIIELGAITPSIEDKSMFAIYKNVEDLSKNLPQKRNPNQMYVGLYIGPDTNIDKIPEWDPSLVDGVRVILRYSELKKSIEYCIALTKKGYKVFVQPMLTMRYSNEELDYIIKASNDMDAFSVYIVDSYGYMTPSDINRLFDFYEERLSEDIHIGFHAHNNMNMAYSNTLHFISKQTNHTLITDSCILGIGQGAGNLQTELILPYLNKYFNKEYDYNSILDLCEIFESKYLNDNEWGYSITRLLPAINKAAYKYGPILRKKHNLSYKEINNFLSQMSNIDKQRFTEDRLKELLKEFHNR